MTTHDLPVLRYASGMVTDTARAIAVEEPLEIFVNDAPFYMTMRLPGEEIPLAMGLCFTEGLIEGTQDILTIDYCREMASNRINVRLGDASSGAYCASFKPKRFTSYTSCGLCGKDLIADIVTTVRKSEKNIATTDAQLAACRELVAAGQEAFRLSGGTHAAGIFDGNGKLLALSEDVGRHNALDKAIGKVLLERKRKAAGIVILTSRLSFEMVQKAARLGAEIVAGISAPTSSAIELADSCDMTLIGLLRGTGGDIYTHPERVRLTNRSTEHT